MAAARAFASTSEGQFKTWLLGISFLGWVKILSLVLCARRAINIQKMKVSEIARQRSRGAARPFYGLQYRVVTSRSMTRLEVNLRPVVHRSQANLRDC